MSHHAPLWLLRDQGGRLPRPRGSAAGMVSPGDPGARSAQANPAGRPPRASTRSRADPSGSSSRHARSFPAASTSVHREPATRALESLGGLWQRRSPRMSVRVQEIPSLAWSLPRSRARFVSRQRLRRNSRDAARRLRSVLLTCSDRLYRATVPSNRKSRIGVPSADLLALGRRRPDRPLPDQTPQSVEIEGHGIVQVGHPIGKADVSGVLTNGDHHGISLP